MVWLTISAVVRGKVQSPPAIDVMGNVVGNVENAQAVTFALTAAETGLLTSTASGAYRYEVWASSTAGQRPLVLPGVCTALAGTGP